jgi:peptidoglycan-N-acetylglucosamine deacetylase
MVKVPLHNRLSKKMLSKIPGPRFVFDRIKSKNRHIALTFDDGPEPILTYKILDALRCYNAKATFFLIGSKIELYPQCVYDIVKDGHEIAIHSYQHQTYSKMSINEIHADIKRCEEIMIPIFSGNKPFLIRPPYGKLSLNVLIYSIMHRRCLAGWTFDSNDSFLESPNEIINYFCSKDLRPGDILLFHEDYERTTSALPKILQYLKDSCYELHTMSKMIFS